MKDNYKDYDFEAIKDSEKVIVKITKNGLDICQHCYYDDLTEQDAYEMCKECINEL